MGDLLYALTEWLRTTRLVELSLWISNTPLSLAIQTHFWAIPIIQTIHILSIAAAFGSVVMMNLRILGLAGGSRTLEQSARRYLPWTWWSLIVLLITGLLMIIGEPVRELINPIFWIKVVLIIVMILVSLWFQARVRRRMPNWESNHERRAAIRAGAVAITLLWCTVMVAGRWIAYAPV